MISTMPFSRLSAPAIVTGILYLSAALPVLPEMPSFIVLGTFVYAALAIWITIVDFRSYRIPDFANVLLATTGVVVLAVADSSALPSHLFAALAGLTIFWFIGFELYRIRNKDHLGAGDAKLLGALLIWVGPWGSMTGLAYASFSALAYATIPKMLGGANIRRKVAFGPFLCFGFYIVWLYGPLGGLE
ncbi:prepilin peptidase [Ruegeria pomeroyi]|uniref:prepilin peptidase n=1 Tax=Ruegeria pomeroyi TaxID=89184 RepID=UPI001F8A1835|nr:prepilin peptidase [Ruegeria pomeroyi]